MPREQETKRERFVRLAEARTNKIIYEYTQQDVDKIFSAIEAEVRDAKKKFSKAETPKNSRFTL